MWCFSKKLLRQQAGNYAALNNFLTFFMRLLLYLFALFHLFVYLYKRKERAKKKVILLFQI